MKSVVAASAALAALAAGVSAQSVPAFRYGTPSASYPGVRGTNKNGPTNPSAPQLNTAINQTSDSRLASLNSVEDWCTFGPQVPGTVIGNVEGETVAYCTKPRNNARVIPDGTVTAAHFVKTPLYVQLMALGDFTKIGLVAGDEGGELDPHGATNMGNPVGGNVTSNVSGQDVFYEEWMNYVSYNQLCFRICIAGSEQAPTALECQHELDVMGCNFVMPGNYADNVFETCEGDAAYPPGLYPQGNGQTSTFHQYYTGEYVVAGTTYSYTNGAADQTTPTAAYSTPSTSNCQTTASISNGIKSLVSSSSSAATTSSSASRSMSTSARGSSSGSGAAATGSGSSGSSGSSSSGSSSSGSTSGASSSLVASAFGIFASVAAVAAGAYLL
ncbi:macrophage activating glycoprotein [Pseudozyma hubeiensis SY62]|uniref:Macrophage activating glycoprotein n=1 Tax=Pseudozyma hubeiensis (strain SY62) TaxID=1305764 RepID=R9P1L7_PSEHS|nr:macrophage activating glycoprotein [Pseudozyma hubeiensis SY62]GAC95032.1 macrophage activating glycoprotein [Pseudozyma hubeiensis SY62]